jgi:hypothetical protein
MVRAAPNLHQVLDDLVSFVGDLPIVSHEASFERRFLWPHDVLTVNEWLDTLSLSRYIWPDAPGHSLSDLADWLHFAYRERHRALPDAGACAQVWLFATGVDALLPEVRTPAIEPVAPEPEPPVAPSAGGGLDYNVTLNVPASTAKSDPAELRVRLTVGLIVKVRVGFPDGCADLVHVAIVRGGHQVWPSNPDGDYAWNDYVYEIEASYVLDDQPLTMKIQAWNEDTANAHQVMVGFNMLPLEPTILGRFVQAVLGRPTRWR